MSKPQKKRSFKKIKKKKSKIKKIKKVSFKKDINLTEASFKEETENIIDDNQFKEFLQPILTPAPVLTKIETPKLELNISSTPISQTKEKRIDYTSKNEQKYSDTTSTDNLDERKYESEFRHKILGQTKSRRTRQEILEPPREAGIQETQGPSIIERNILEQQRREPFETQEKKYNQVEF
jgi:hypothetical protein